MSLSSWWPVAGWLLLMGGVLLVVSWRTIPRRRRALTVWVVLGCNLVGSVGFAWRPSVWVVVGFAFGYCAALVWSAKGFRRRRWRLPVMEDSGTDTSITGMLVSVGSE